MINHAMLAKREHFNEFTSALRVMLSLIHI